MGGIFQIDAVLDDLHTLGEFAKIGRLVGAVDLTFDPDAQVALLGEKIEKVLWSGVFGNFDAEGQKNRLAMEVGKNLAENGLGSALNHFPRALWTEALGYAREKEFQVIVDFRDRANGRPRGADIVGLLDRDGGRNSFNVIGQRLIHPLEELARVGTECLHIAPLSLGIDGVEGEA